MTGSEALRFGPLGESCVHLCVDMQRLFAERTEWHMPWMERVLPKVADIAGRHAARTIFTRFLPAEQPGDGHGTWKRYYQRWAGMTVRHLGRDMVELVPELATFVPPGRLLDKRVYSPWCGTDLHRRLRDAAIDTLVVTGGETDVCVLSTVLGAVDLGYRVVIATDAICSSSDATHDALLSVYGRRYGQQVEAVAAEVVLASWSYR